MKKSVLVLLLLVVTSLTGAAQFRWGATAGFNWQKYHFKQDLMEVNPNAGFSAGILGELMFPGIGFGMDFGLLYEQHGSSLHFEQKPIWASDGFGEMRSQIHLIQLPVNLRFKYTRLNGLENTVAPFIFAGPVFNIQVGHNSCPPLEYAGGSVGLQVQGGAELFKCLQVSAGYYWDLTYETRTRKLENFSARPQGLQIKVSYLFNR